jgi:hypothetical protein
MPELPPESSSSEELLLQAHALTEASAAIMTIDVLFIAPHPRNEA